MNFHSNANSLSVARQESYRDQLMRIARCLAAGNAEAIQADLAEGSSLAHVKLFTDGNLEQRFEKLQQQVDFVAAAFERLDELMEAFLRSVALDAYDTGASDGDRFLAWLEKTQEPTAEQCDYIACQRARYGVEEAARRNRLAHVRFQELLSQAEALSAELPTNRTLEIRLNPIHMWTQFETAELLDGSAQLPATLVCFPVGSEIRIVLLEGDALERVRELAAFGPCTLDAWRARLDPFVDTADIPRSSLIALCRDLAQLGLVAFA